MSKRLTAHVFVKGTAIKCMSVNGNPSYWVDFETKYNRLCEFGYRRGHTASDSQCGYSVNNLVGKVCEMGYHFSTTGNLIIDDMKGCYYDY